MTVTLELPSNLEAELSQRAAQHGQALPDYLLALAEADVLGEYELSQEDHQAETSLIQERIQDRLSGDKGILLEEYWASVLAKRQARDHRQAAEQSA